MKVSTIALLSLAALAGSAQAQTAYRCGNTISQTPCGPDAKTLQVAAPPEDFAAIERRLKQPVKDNPPPADVIAANTKLCEDRIRASMKDPEAAKISGSMRVGAHNHSIGGKILPVVSYTTQVNGKNSYGGYTGVKTAYCLFTLDESAIIKLSSF